LSVSDGPHESCGDRVIRVALALFVTSVLLVLAGCSEDRDETPVEAAVVNGYRSYTGHRAVTADCDYADDNANGSEWWWCDVEANDPLGADTCTVDVRRRADGRVAARFRYCLSVDG